MMIFQFLIITILLCSCGLKNSPRPFNGDHDSIVKKIIEIEEAIGVIVLDDSYEFGDTIDFFDNDTNLIEFIVIDEEYQTLNFRCIKIGKDFYSVKNKLGQNGFIKRNQKGVVFETWEEHVLNSFGIGFNYQSNPILEQPNDNEKIINYVRDVFFHPVEIKDNWLKIKWKINDEYKFGWVKWYEDKKLLIEIFDFA